MTVELLSAAPEGGVDLLVGGDVVLRGPGRGRLDDGLAALVRGATTVVNLEAPLVDSESPAPKAGPHLGLPTNTAAELCELGVDVVGLANNHLGDHGAAGVRSTIAACAAVGLQATGAGEDLASALRPASLEIAGTRVAVLAAAEHEFGIAAAGRPGVAPVTGPALRDAITRARASHDVVVVLAHGGVEELPVSPPQRAAQLRGLVDAGADLVVGAHPHAVQGWEEHGDGLVVHSAGDLLFDRGDDAVQPPPPGALVCVALEAGRVARIGLLAVERRGDRVGVADPGTLRALADTVGDRGLWQELAWTAFVDRYLPLLRRIGAPVAADPAGIPGLRTARALRDRLGLDSAPARPPDGWEALHLLNQLRCESQRWTTETALELAGGLVEDERSAATRDRAAALLRAAGYGAAG